MRLTRRLTVLLVAGVLSWGGVTGFAVAAVADIGPQCAAGVAGQDGARGADGKDGADGADNTKRGARGPAGEKGPTGAQGAKGPKYQPKTHTVMRRSGTGDYSGARITVDGGTQMSVKYTVACDSYFPFLSLTWDGDALGDYDYMRVDSGNQMSGTQYLNPSSDSGSFEIRTQDSCSWAITVTQRY